MSVFKLISSGGCYIPGKPLSVVEALDDETVVVQSVGGKRTVTLIEDLGEDKPGEIEAAIAAANKRARSSVGVDVSIDDMILASNWYSVRGYSACNQSGGYVTQRAGRGDFN